MPNNLATALVQSRNTFIEFRQFLVEKGFTKQQIESVENGLVEVYIPRCIKYIEHLGINFNTALNYLVWERPELSYWELVIATIIEVFKKTEKNDFDYDTF